jgi:Domain of unknown function (DUF5658)
MRTRVGGSQLPSRGQEAPQRALSRVSFVARRVSTVARPTKAPALPACRRATKARAPKDFETPRFAATAVVVDDGTNRDGSTHLAAHGGVVASRIIIAAFLIAQVCDGVLTYAAIQLFGASAEGNPIITTWMTLVGPEPAIVGAKVLASVCGVILYVLGVHRILLALTFLYGAAAVVPWLAIFHRL